MSAGCSRSSASPPARRRRGSRFGSGLKTNCHLEAGGRTPNFPCMPIAIITGASRGLGLALAHSLAAEGWSLVIDARGADALERAATELRRHTEVVAIAGDVTDPDHRAALVNHAGDSVDALVNNASVLGPSPQPALAAYPLEEIERVYRNNVFAPLALTQLVLPRMVDGGAIV